jgi:DNA polymerase III subunit delta
MKDFQTILKDLKNKVYFPYYLLCGEESFYIDEISSWIEKNVLTDEEKEFNQTIVYGRDTDVLNLVGVCKRYPMVSNHQVVIVKEAQDLKNPDALLPYLEKPLQSTLLVLCHKHGKPDKRKSFVKTIDKKGVLFESPRIYDNQVPSWINTYLTQRGYSIQPKAAQLLAEFLGTDLSRIVNELGKLIINLPEKTEINTIHIEQNIGISKDFNVTELQRAIGSGDIFKANQIIRYFAQNEKENPLVKVIPILFSYFQKIFIVHNLKDKSRNNVAAAIAVNPYFAQEYISATSKFSRSRVARVISILRDYDLKIKGVNCANPSDSELMKEMVYRIMH